MNELIRELVEALETCKSTRLNMVGPNDEGVHLSHDHDMVSAALAKARAYLETGGWTRVGETYTMQAIAPHSSVITHARLDRSLPPGTELFARIATPEPPKG